MVECSSQAWKRSACWGWTEQEARNRLVEHLVTSSKHHMQREEAINLAEEHEIRSDVYEQQTKKQRRVEGSSHEQGGSQQHQI